MKIYFVIILGRLLENMFSETEYFEGFYVIDYSSRNLFMKCQSGHIVYSTLISPINDTSDTVF